MIEIHTRVRMHATKHTHKHSIYKKHTPYNPVCVYLFYALSEAKQQIDHLVCLVKCGRHNTRLKCYNTYRRRSVTMAKHDMYYDVMCIM